MHIYTRLKNIGNVLMLFEEFTNNKQNNKVMPYNEWVPSKGYQVIYKGSIYTLLQVNSYESAKNITADIPEWNFDNMEIYDQYDMEGSIYLICENSTLAPVYFFHKNSKSFKNKNGEGLVSENDIWDLFGDPDFLTAFSDILKFGRTQGHFNGF